MDIVTPGPAGVTPQAVLNTLDALERSGVGMHTVIRGSSPCLSVH